MQVFEAVRMALASIWSQKLKSGFSLIGVLIGVMFLIAVVSVVQGMNSYMEDRVANRLIGANTFQLRQRPSFSTGNITREEWLAWRRRPRITYADADYIEERLATPALMAKYCADRVTIGYQGKVARDIDLIGTEATYFQIRDYQITEGRAFTPQELRAAAPVLVIGSLLAEKLFAGQDPLGKSVTVGGLPYRVIGVVEKQGTMFGLSLDKFAIMPFTAHARRLICPINVLDELIIKSPDVPTMQMALQQTEALMRGRRGLKPEQPNNFHLQTPEAALVGWRKISGFLMTFLPIIVGISLVVGGMVIMNIMLMSVAERTREIGIRKALGARRYDILLQFVVESATLSLVGAGAGVLFGFGLAFGVDKLTPMPAAVAPWSIGVALALGIVVGMVAGVYPAHRASRLDPIEALRAD